MQNKIPGNPEDLFGADLWILKRLGQGFRHQFGRLKDILKLRHRLLCLHGRLFLGIEDEKNAGSPISDHQRNEKDDEDGQQEKDAVPESQSSEKSKPRKTKLQ